MGGDVEFVNTFMSKMKDKLHDHLGQVMMLETHNELAMKRLETVSEELTAKLTASEQFIVGLEKENEALREQVSAGEKEIAFLKSQAAQLNINISELSGEVNRLNGTINAKEQDILAKQKEITQLISDKNSMSHLVEEGLSLKSQINTLNMEVESAKFREQSITDDYAKLVNEHQALKDKYKETKAPVVPATPIKKK
jgi:chromosome segregation ATPase